MSRIEIIATGPELIRQGIRGIEPVIEELINEAYDEILYILIYLFTLNALHIFDLL